VALPHQLEPSGPGAPMRPLDGTCEAARSAVSARSARSALVLARESTGEPHGPIILKAQAGALRVRLTDDENQRQRRSRVATDPDEPQRHQAPPPPSRVSHLRRRARGCRHRPPKHPIDRPACANTTHPGVPAPLRNGHRGWHVSSQMPEQPLRTRARDVLLAIGETCSLPAVPLYFCGATRLCPGLLRPIQAETEIPIV
jgi:hypothetical protein